MKDANRKRLFFGLETLAPWPEKWPAGRLIEERFRHLTLLFLGTIASDQLLPKLSSLPQLPFKFGQIGRASRCLILPDSRRPCVAAWEFEPFGEDLLTPYHQKLVEWAKGLGFSVDERPLLKHITLARGRFQPDEWKEQFVQIPMVLKDLKLYESLGHSQFETLYRLPLLAPFEEIEHTADIAFLVRGENDDQLFTHAQMALGFYAPSFVPFFSNKGGFANLDAVVRALNELVTQADAEVGCPFKAVSFHDTLQNGAVSEEGYLTWEMIVDV